ncbi:hypothetical protein EC973_005204 [Apophysomyces ossiformis]|uniref:Wax synthase domain-containing protein n=1 Tax=Apophysomyces ossiformis TaxID=679940 RepID=A0A8H7BY03_9FUNG|nr:hypothetical protein EC973_005204 [Apophysomyces ossiformis]
MATLPLVEVPLPEPTVLPPIQYAGLFITAACVDYIVLANETKLGIGATIFRYLRPLTYLIIPIAFVSGSIALDITSMGQFWFIVSVHSQLPLADISLKDCLWTHFSMLLEDPSAVPKRQFYSDSLAKEIRAGGLKKIANGVAKSLFGMFIVHPLLIDNPVDILSMPWWHWEAILQTLLCGLRIYCLLGVNDIAFGFGQAVLGLEFVEAFHWPMFATGRRWNMIVHRLFYRSLYAKKQKTDSTGPWASPVVRCLTIFVISGVFHEVIVMSLARVMTLENLAFFILHGFGTVIDTKLQTKSPEGWNRVACVMLYTLFLGLTLRLFLAPYLRLEIPEPIL